MTTRKRWPNGVAQQRDDAADLITKARDLQRQARALLRESQQHVQTNPRLKEMMDLKASEKIADAETMLADALRFLEEAKHGL